MADKSSDFPRGTRRMPMIGDDLKLPEEGDGGRPSSTYGQNIIIMVGKLYEIYIQVILKILKIHFSYCVFYLFFIIIVHTLFSVILHFR